MSVSVSGGGSAAGAVQPPPEYVAAVTAIREAQNELAALIQTQATTHAQENEMNMVKRELDAIKDGEHVYKLHGKILVRQPLAEAKSVIDGRLTFITAESNRVEASIKAAQEKMNGLRKKIIDLQTSYAKAAAGSAAK